MINKLSAAHIVEALGDADVVVLTRPDGSQSILRGADRLARIAESGHSEPVCLARLPVATDMEAEIIAAALQVIETSGMGPAKVATLQRLLDQARALQ
jgi:RecA/RadA recombinase